MSNSFEVYTTHVGKRYAIDNISMISILVKCTSTYSLISHRLRAQRIRYFQDIAYPHYFPLIHFKDSSHFYQISAEISNDFWKISFFSNRFRFFFFYTDSSFFYFLFFLSSLLFVILELSPLFS